MDEKSCRERMLEMRKKGLTYRDLSFEFRAKDGRIIPPRTMERIVRDGKFPKKDWQRDALGVPRFAEVQVCSSCGLVHTTKRCTTNKKKGYPDLFAMPTEVLLWALNNREEI